MFRLPAVLLAAALLSPAAAFAQTVTYNCALTVPRNQNWVAQQIVIGHDTATDAVVINDPIIDNLIGQPVQGKVAVDNDKRITFAWELPEIRNSSGQYTPRFIYRATYIKATGKVSVLAKPLNYQNNFSARGNCTVK